MVIHDDVTDRKQAEKALSYALQRADAHMDNSPLAVVEFDAQFRIIRWSQEAERMFGWSAEEVMGQAIAELHWVHDDDVESVQQESAALFSGARPRSLNVNRNYRNDGSVIHCEWYSSAIYDGAGNLISVLSQVLDITERIRAAEEQERLQEQVLAAERARAQLAENLNNEIAHRVKNNLAMVSGLLQMQALGHPDPDTSKALREAVARVQVFAHIHEQMYSRHSQQVDLLATLERITTTMREVFAARREVHFSLTGEPLLCSSRLATNLSVVANELHHQCPQARRAAGGWGDPHRRGTGMAARGPAPRRLELRPPAPRGLRSPRSDGYGPAPGVGDGDRTI